MEILPTDYYTSMLTILSDVDIIFTLFCIQHPKISQSINCNKEKLTSMLLSWLICLFSREPIHKEVTRAIWDCLMVEGIVAIYKAALAMLCFLKNVLENVDDE